MQTHREAHFSYGRRTYFHGLHTTKSTKDQVEILQRFIVYLWINSQTTACDLQTREIGASPWQKGNKPQQCKRRFLTTSAAHHWLKCGLFKQIFIADTFHYRRGMMFRQARGRHNPYTLGKGRQHEQRPAPPTSWFLLLTPVLCSALQSGYQCLLIFPGRGDTIDLSVDALIHRHTATNS